MTFGKRAPKKQKIIKKEHKDEANLDRNDREKNKKNIDKNDSADSSNNGFINNDTIVGIKIKKQKVKKFNASDFLKKSGKGNISNILLFGQTKEQKLNLFITNLTISHPAMPEFWRQNEISKFKKKFKID